ncbi:MAG: hypothetical protein ACETWM_09190 [Candidatus Lokiarchaeia archaeon]
MESGASVLELASLLGLGSLLSAAVGSALKWYFDRKTRETEVFKKTFERFSKLTSEYYIPMAVEGGRTGRLLRQLYAPKPPEPQFVFFTLTRFQLCVLRYVQSGGGYLMRDLKDERIQANLYLRARRMMPLTDTDIAVMQDIAATCDRYTIFKKKLEHPSAKSEGEVELKEAYDRFVKWLNENPQSVQGAGSYLQHYRDYIMKNITELYSGWYKKSSLSESAKEAVKKIKKQIEKTERRISRKIETELKEVGLKEEAKKKRFR